MLIRSSLSLCRVSSFSENKPFAPSNSAMLDLLAVITSSSTDGRSPLLGFFDGPIKVRETSVHFLFWETLSSAILKERGPPFAQADSEESVESDIFWTFVENEFLQMYGRLKTQGAHTSGVSV